MSSAMPKPKSPICDKCFVKRNKLRCALCKHKTEEWVVSNLPILCADLDGFQSKEDWDRWRNEQKVKGEDEY